MKRKASRPQNGHQIPDQDGEVGWDVIVLEVEHFFHEFLDRNMPTVTGALTSSWQPSSEPPFTNACKVASHVGSWEQSQNTKLARIESAYLCGVSQYSHIKPLGIDSVGGAVTHIHDERCICEYTDNCCNFGAW